MMTKSDRDNVKISFGTPKFIVNNKAKLVICVLDFIAKMPTSLRETIYWKNPTTTPEFTRTVKSVAFTKKGDTFDENVGKKIALAKAENQAYNYVRNHMVGALKELTKSVKAISTFNAKTKRVINHNVEYMKKF